ncbi:MAG TPA: hypothetical protein VEH29_17220 [Acidimicrobiales bacterium]|nr:hypothetical protein [Acidimicrobiales bacterium]
MSNGSSSADDGTTQAPCCDAEPGENPPAKTALRSSLWLGLIAAGLFLLLACLAYWPVAPLDAGHIVGCPCSDQAQEVWYVNWTAFAVLHGHNPFFTGYLAVPGGANLGLDTAMPLLGFLGLPVTATAGAVAAYNVLLRVALAVSGFSMYLLLRRYTTWWPAALLGGLLYGFSAYMIGQGRGHLFLTFVPLPPLMIGLVDDWLVRRRRPPALSGAFVGATAGLQYLISPEVLAMTLISIGVGLLAVCLRYRARVKERLSTFLAGLVVAAGVFALLAGYPIWMLLAGPRNVKGPAHSVYLLSVYRNTVLGVILPTANEVINPTWSARFTNPYLLHDPAENGLYLGAPLLLLLVALVVRCRRVGVVVAAAAAGAVALVLSMGSRLQLGRHSTHVPLPFVLLTHLRLLQSIEPARFSLFVQLAAALILGVGLDRLRSEGFRLPPAHRPPARERAQARRHHVSILVLALGVLVLVPLLPRLPYKSASMQTPAFFTSPAARTIPAGAVAVTFPWNVRPDDDGMLWQVASGMRFRLLSGDVFVPGADGKASAFIPPPGPRPVRQLLLEDSSRYKGPDPPDDAATRAAMRQLLTTQSVGVVLVLGTSPGASEVEQVTTQVLGKGPLRFGTMDVWLVGRTHG